MKARRAIWKTFISRAHSSTRTHSSFKDEEIDELAKHEMNGRQVCRHPHYTMMTYFLETLLTN